MKKSVRIILLLVGVLAAAGIYYYVTLPAVNIHSEGFWVFAMSLIILAIAARIAYNFYRRYKDFGTRNLQFDFRSDKPAMALGILFAAVLVIFIFGSVLSSPVVNAGKYQRLLAIEEREFTEDIKEVDYHTIPLLDKDSAALLGDRKMGSMVDMVSQFEVSTDYTQINYNGTPVRVTPLVYASPIKWFTNQKEGIPAYILIDMATQDTECVKLTDKIKYSKSEYFNRNLYRHLRFRYPTYIFDDQIFFEIDDEGTPFWVCPVKKFNIGLFGGETVGKVVLWEVL